MINVRAADAVNNFVKIKNTISAIIDEYSIGRVRYSVILYGDVASVKVQFGDSFLSEKSLKSFINVLPRPRGGADLAKAMETAAREFEKSVRPVAKRVLVVVTDSRSDSRLDDVRNASKSLERASVKVVPVAFGKDADKLELQSSSQEGKDNLIDVKEPFEPKVLAKQIMSTALKGKMRFHFTSQNVCILVDNFDNIV